MFVSVSRPVAWRTLNRYFFSQVLPQFPPLISSPKTISTDVKTHENKYEYCISEYHGDVKMDERHKKLLQNNWTYLLTNITLGDLLDYMFSNDIITVGMMEEVNARRTSRDKISHFLLTLQRRGPSAFNVFIDGLRETQQGFIADELLRSLQGNMEQ